MYFTLALFVAILKVGICGDVPTVNIRDTTFKGVNLFLSGSTKPVFSFRGIYYAEPPVGMRRFMPPVTKRLPPGDYDATKHGPLCPQDLVKTTEVFPQTFPTNDSSENCLHLDIYTPSLDPTAKLAVMVFYHGGAFTNGGGGFYDGTAFAAIQDVVLVAANYRLGALGFLSTGDEAAFGNYGLLDQQMVLQWVHNHIAGFGGDPKRVTIFGESAGAVAVALHLQSSFSQGFFHRAISQSGVAHSPIMMSQQPLHVAKRLAERLQCPTSSSRAIVECLRSKSPEEILAVNMEAPDIPAMPFSPVVDGLFIDEDPVVALMRGHFNPQPQLLLGVNNHEGGFNNLAHRLSGDVFKHFSAKAFRLMLQYEFNKFMPGDMSEIIEGVEHLYGGRQGVTDESALQILTEVLGDCVYLVPAVTLADVFTGVGGKVYFYEYQHRLSYSPAPEWVKADHGDEEALVFGSPFLEEDRLGQMSFTTDERALSLSLMTYWANFAKTGNPNGEGDNPDLPLWRRYTVQEKAYMKLDMQSELAQNLKPDKVAFWSQLMASARKQVERDEL
ncbi:carboxylesterase 5A-like [Diadema setosum]|uniref:carboxylesterase 5A-like n=1 Tax=Diadema setosum TaxID=31175 RepID=UPI003B3A3355